MLRPKGDRLLHRNKAKYLQFIKIDIRDVIHYGISATKEKREGKEFATMFQKGQVLFFELQTDMKRKVYAKCSITQLQARTTF